MTEIRNLTPHTINLVSEEGELLQAYESVGLARVASSEIVVSNELGFPETETVYGEVEGLPEEQEGVLLIVSRLVLGRCPERRDLRAPGLQVRNELGQVVGCKSLARN